MGEFQRNGSPESSRWKTNADEFRGYVRAKLEDLDKNQEDQWKSYRLANERIMSLERREQYQRGGIAVLYAAWIVFAAAYGTGLISF